MSECPYIVGNECDIAKCEEFHVSRKEKIELLDKVADRIPKEFCTYCNQEACDGGMVGTIQECQTIRMMKDVLDEVIAELKAEIKEVR